jgi:hypothetical protein
MPDEIDRAQDHMEREEAFRKTYTAAPKLAYECTGFCLNCTAKVAEGERWCDVDCREDFLKRVRP